MKKAIITLAMGFALVAGLVALEWTPDRSVASLQARWAPPPSTFVTIDGMSVHLCDEGPGNDPHPIVLIHGTASSLLTWRWLPARATASIFQLTRRNLHDQRSVG